MKFAIIYDKWLSGLGGGEVVACNMAVSLRDAGYDVTLLSKDIVSKEEIRSKLRIDLTGVRLTNDLTLLNPKSKTLNSNQLTNSKFQKLNNQTTKEPNSQPDLFINLSFMDYTYGFAKKNIYYVHFPSPIRSGLFNHALTFFQTTNFHSLFPSRLKEKISDRLRAGIYHDLQKRLDSYDTFITHSQYVAKWVKKEWNKETKVIYPPVQLNSKPQTLNPKQITNHKSQIPNKQTTKELNNQETKHNWICSLGRFFTLGHGKKQEIMIEAFKEICDSNNFKYQMTNVKSTNQILNPKYQKKLNNQSLIANRQFANSPINLQLHLIGGVGKEPSSVRFVEQLMEMAKGYPIFFHFNVSRTEVEEILLKSKIYWHAAGFGENQGKNPIKFEHFGIAPVEAISAGCIPILYNGGGLPEIVNLLQIDPQLHLFRTMEELISNTKKIMSTQKPLYNIDQQILGKKFSQKNFATEFMKLTVLK